MSDRAPALERIASRRRAADRTSLRAIFPTVAAASLGFAIVQLDVTVVNVAIPSLGHSFRIERPRAAVDRRCVRCRSPRCC